MARLPEWETWREQELYGDFIDADAELEAQLGMDDPDPWSGEEFAQVVGAEPQLHVGTSLKASLESFSKAAMKCRDSMSKFAMSVASTHEPVADHLRGLRSWSAEVKMILSDLKMHELALGDDAIDVVIVQQEGVQYSGKAFVSSYAHNHRIRGRDAHEVSLTLMGAGELTRSSEPHDFSRIPDPGTLVIGPRELVALEWSTDHMDTRAHHFSPGGLPGNDFMGQMDEDTERHRFMTRGLSR